MWGFLLGVIVGAVGFWAYRLWKGEEDMAWDQSFSSSSSSYTSEPVGSSAVDSGTTPPGGAQ